MIAILQQQVNTIGENQKMSLKHFSTATSARVFYIVKQLGSIQKEQEIFLEKIYGVSKTMKLDQRAFSRNNAMTYYYTNINTSDTKIYPKNESNAPHDPNLNKCKLLNGTFECTPLKFE